jgi:signal transduction histidine kinase
MLFQFFLGLLVLVVAALVAVDGTRTSSESPHGQADRQAHDAQRGITGAPRDTGAKAFLAEPTGTPIPTAVHGASQAPRPESISPPARDRRDSRTGTSAAHTRSVRELKDWPVRSRLLLLVIVPTVAVTVVAFCVARIAGVLHSPGSSGRDGAILSVVTVGAVLIIVVASWATIVVARSVLQPLYKLRVGALEVAVVRLPDAVRRIGESNGGGMPSKLEPIDVDSSDEIGEIARAVDQMRKEMLRLTADETGLRGKLNAMFANLSHRSQSLVERQIRLIGNLEQGEQDAERQANLLKMNRIAARMQRNSQNLLVLAGHEPPSGRNQPVSLVNVIRAAVSDIDEYERVSVNVQPDIAVRGPAVNDVVHLLAELTENATSFSAAEMPVDISGHILTSGGVLVDITDRGIGMTAKEMAYANWQLENPSAADFNVFKWMGLSVVARLAARHAIRVRLHPAEFGGLKALVWLPGEVITHHGAAASPRLSGFVTAGSRPHLPEAAVDSGHAPAEQGATMARSAELAPPREDGQDVPPGRRLISDPGRWPGPTRSASGPEPVFQAESPATVRSFGSGLPAAMGEHVGVPAQEAPALGDQAAGGIAGGTLGTDPLSGVGLSAPSGSQPSQLASAPVGTAAFLSQETSSADSGVIVPPAEGLVDTRRLPIFDEVESLWFKGGRQAPGSPGLTAAAGGRWSSPADKGWHAAEAVDSPSSSGPTVAGLPRRQPNANLVPGAIPSTEPVALNRSAAAARERFAGFQRGISQGRAAAGEAANSGGENES